MTILLDGDAFPGFDHRITANGQIDRKDFSGDGSSTAGGHAGWKAWLLQVRLKIAMEDADDLLALRAMFQADGFTERTTTTVDETGTEQTTVTSTPTGVPKIWEITDDTAAALGIFKVRFTEVFKVEPDDALRLWNVVATLIEVRSRPELLSERLPAGSEQTPGAPSGTQTPAGATPSAGEPTGWFEELLGKFDALLGKYVFPAPKKE